MNNYCVDLALPCRLFKSSLPEVDFLKQQNKESKGHFQISKQLLSNELILFFNKCGLDVRLVEIFYRRPNVSGNIHSDMDIIGDYAKLNWVFGSGDMLWYNINSNYKTPITHTTDINSYALYYKESEVDLIHKQKIAQPSLVQVGIPHNVINHDTERFCVSVVFEYVSSKQRPTCQEAISIFKDYIK